MKIKFGIHLAPQMGFDYQTVKTITLNVESLDYNLVTLGDHLFLDDKSEERNCMETWTLLTALAAQTSKINLGTLVTCNSYRHPSILAKIAATVDLISEGRLVFGIGAGWKKIEYDAYGIRFPPVGERMDQLEEAIQIICKLWTEPKATFKGKHYQIKNAFSAPKPIQQPHPPILIGGAGEKRTLKLVAKYANMCNFTWNEGKKVDRLLKILKKHCNSVGRDYDSIEKTFLVFCFISRNENEIKARCIELAKRRGLSLERHEAEIYSEPGIWYGTPEQVGEKCQYLIDKGFTQFQVRFIEEKELQMSQLFANTIMNRI